MGGGRTGIDIKALAKEHNRPIETLIALHANHDPFYFTPGRIRAAKWLHEIWSRLGIEVAHIRRILRAEIMRYHDPELAGKITLASIEARKQLEPINEKIAKPFCAEVSALEAEYQEIRGRLADLGERAKVAHALRWRRTRLTKRTWSNGQNYQSATRMRTRCMTAGGPTLNR